MKQRLLSILTALALCLTLLPTATLADESITGLSDKNSFIEWNGTGDTPTGPYKKTSGSGDEYYLPTGHYKLEAGISDICIRVIGTVTLDLNGNTLTGPSSASALAVGWVGFNSSDAGNLTLTDSSEAKNGKVTGAEKAISVNDGSLTLVSGTVSTSNDSGFAISLGDSTIVTLKGGKVTAENGSKAISMQNPSTLNADGGTVNGLVENKSGTITRSAGATDTTTFTGDVTNKGTIKGGTFGSDSVPSGAVTNEGTITGGTFNYTITNKGIISGGTFTNTSTAAVINGGTISGGTFKGVHNCYIEDSTTQPGTPQPGTTQPSTIHPGTITGGTFSLAVENGGTISGGTFNGDVSNGYKYNYSGSDIVNPGTISGGTFNGTVTNRSLDSCKGALDNSSKKITNNGKFVFANGYEDGETNITADTDEAKTAALQFIDDLSLSGFGYVAIEHSGTPTTYSYYSNTCVAVNVFTPPTGETGEVATLDLSTWNDSWGENGTSAYDENGNGYSWTRTNTGTADSPSYVYTLTLKNVVISGILKLPYDGNVTIKTEGYVNIQTIVSALEATSDLIFDDADLTVGNITWHHNSSSQTTNGVVLRRSKLTVVGEDGICAGDITIDALSMLDLQGAKLSTNDASNFNNLKNYLPRGYQVHADGTGSPTNYVYSGTNNVLTLTLGNGPQIGFTVTMSGGTPPYPDSITLEVFSDDTLSGSPITLFSTGFDPNNNNGTLTTSNFLSNYDDIVALFANEGGTNKGIYVTLVMPDGWKFTSGDQVYYVTYSNNSTGGGSGGVSTMALPAGMLLAPAATMLFTAGSAVLPMAASSEPSTPPGLVVYKTTGDTYTPDYSAPVSMTFDIIPTSASPSGGGSGGSGGSGSTWYTITASAGTGGSISPSGAVSVRRGSDKTFTVSPAQGYVLSDLLVDGKSVGTPTTYTFENVKTSHTIKAVFKTDPASQTDPDRPVGLNSTDHVAYVQGYADGTVRPNAPVTRAQVAVILYRLLTPERLAEIETDAHSFTDVTAADWYSHEVATMANGGYISGYADGSFGGNDPITRAQFVTILTRFLSQRDVDCDFTDVPARHWAYNAIATAVDAGWIAGYADGSFRPDQPVTRAQVMAIINRALDRGVDANSQLLGAQSFTDNPVTAWHYYEVIEAANGHDYTGHRPSENWTALR